MLLSVSSLDQSRYSESMSKIVMVIKIIVQIEKVQRVNQ